MPRSRSSGGGSHHGGMPMLNGAPWYVKAVLYLLAWFGFPVAAAVVMFLAAIGIIPSPITETRAHIEAHRQETGELLKLVVVNTKLQRQICRNTSTNAVERTLCDQ